VLLLSLLHVAPWTPKLRAKEETQGLRGVGVYQFMPCEMELALLVLWKTGKIERELSEQLRT